MLTIDLSDRVTLVVGGSKGIGASVVRLAAQAGSKVAWTDKAAEPTESLRAELAGLGFDVHSGIVDCTDAAANAAFVEDVITRWGRIDHLVYCAGFTSPVKFMDITPEEWSRVVALNLNGAFFATRAVIPQMVEQGTGSIVLVGSAAVETGGGGRADYVSAKSGIEGLNLAITREFAPQGIRCNLVHPSLIDTDLLRQRHSDPETREKLAAAVPLRRLGRPDDVANLALYLLSDLAGYITGQRILVDGGRTRCS
jgi:NAD(P)-dependent dehydrogenase (short-subunit alcohol dehydrogenase family)